MHSAELQAWLDKIRRQHGKSMDLGLARVAAVARQLDLLQPTAKVIIVGGTNGKGSTVAGLEAIYLAAGYRVGTFTSPYLFRFNEEIKIAGQEVSDETLIRAFEQVEAARGDVTLTVFEFNTLTALWLFREAAVDVMVLEVGLGGRLDAVNIIDADVSVVTSIALDHMDWLGDTRELIGREKAGIFRTDKPAVCGDLEPPETLVNYAEELQTPLFCQGKQFGWEKQNNTWRWWSESRQLDKLPLPRLALQNMATVLMVIELLQSELSVSVSAIEQALQSVTLPGRIQVLPGTVTTILDVSHNPAAAQFLANHLQQFPFAGKTRAVFSMLADKDIVATLQVMKNYIDEWHVAPLQVERGALHEKLIQSFQQAEIENVFFL